MIYKNASKKVRLKFHFCLLIFFLIVGHVAIIFGMVNPTTTGYRANEGAMNMPMHDHHKMMMQNMSDDKSTNMYMHH